MQIAKAGREVTTLKLPSAAATLLMQVLDEMGKGQAVSLVPTEREITTQEAANLLNVSRPHVVDMIAKGKLPARMVGNQRRLLIAAVLAYKAKAKAEALEAMEEISVIDQELRLR